MNKKGSLKALLLVIIAAATLEVTGLVQFYFSQKGIREEAGMRAESQLDATRNRIMDVVNQAEAAVRNSVWIAQWCMNYPDSLQRVCWRLVEDNPVVIGSTVALVPGYNARRPLLAPYVFRNPEGELQALSLATESYDYPSQEWFVKPLETGGGYWSEPYVDTGGGEMLMTTYSMPIRDYNGKLAAVLTADISLDWLTELVGNVKVYPQAFSIMLSRSGRLMVSPAESLVMKKTVGEYVSEMDDTTGLTGLTDALMSGRSGNMAVNYKGATSYVYFSPVERTGWSMSIVIPESDIYANLRSIGTLVMLLQVLGLLLIIFMLRSFFKGEARYNALDQKRQRIEGELHIATGIQMSMVPKSFPAFPERHDLDMAATIVPAKEVGGDLYDFFIRDEKLFFCVGDVSGKGIPAALVMAVTRTSFRNLSSSTCSPGRIVTAMNDSLSAMNESSMFVTLFCGVLNLVDGNLLYCNAGHNPPRILTDAIRTLPVEPNLPLGIMPGFEYKEQETVLKYDDAIFLYTDGLTEAENINHEQFGEERTDAVLHQRRSAQGHLEAVKKAVAGFVGEAEQSDDLTMLFVHYLNQTHSEMKERSIELLNDVRQIPRMAEFVEAVVAEKKIDNDVAMGIHLAIEEAVTNVMMYAYPEGTEGSVELKAVMTSDRLSFILSDRGKPFDPTAAPDPDVTASAEDRPIGGLGIHLVRRIMDSVQYERKDGKNYLTMTKNI